MDASSLVEQGRAVLAREMRMRNPKKKGIDLSAVRSFVFNEVLALRNPQGLWGQTLPGGVMDPAGRPTGPLCGWPRADQLVLTSSLKAGGNATAVLNEILRTTEPDRHTENAVAAGA